MRGGALGRIATALTWVLPAFLCASDVLAQRLPVRCYDLTDGLVQNLVRVVAQDRKGFLWIGTAEGVSRFDGYQFVNYGLADGLENVYINDIVEDRDGRLWFATNGGGIAVLDAKWIEDSRTNAKPETAGAPANRKKFVSFRVTPSTGAPPDADNVNAFAIDAIGDGAWCATDAGLFHARFDRDGALTFRGVPQFKDERVTAARVDRHGRLWLHTTRLGILHTDNERLKRSLDAPDAASTSLPHSLQTTHGGFPNDHTFFDEDSHGVVRIAGLRTIYQLIPRPVPQLEAPKVPGPVLHSGQHLMGMRSDSIGRLWLGMSDGLFVQPAGRPGAFIRVRGFTSGPVAPMFEDRDGTMWLSRGGNGLCRVSPSPVVSYTTAEGLPAPSVDGVFEGSDGRIYAAAGLGFVEVLEDAVVPVDGSDRAPFNRIGRKIVAGRHGGWWALLEDGVLRLAGARLRFDRTATTVPVQTVFAESSHLPGTIRSPGLYEDPTGDIWFTGADGSLQRLRRDGTAGREKAQASMAVASPGPLPLTVITGDGSGALWLANMSQLARYSDGQIQFFQTSDGLPETFVRSMHFDRRGRLWVGLRFRGVSMTTDPRAPNPRFVNYSTRNGLASDTIWSIAEDDVGRIYLGTGRGLDRLDPETGRIRHFTTADGLAGNLVNFLLADRSGNVWIATTSGLSKLSPRAERVAVAPAHIYLTDIRIAGESLPLPETGVVEWPSVSVPASRNNLVIEYVSPDIRPDHALRYQYRLEGVDREWGEPTDQRTVNYSRLAPGDYRFEVRAIDSEGRVSPKPASATFRIDRPIWQSGWAIVMITLAVAGIATALQRIRTRQLLAMERVRRQVATDLHDDLGSGLSQIAILSEVAKRIPTHGKRHLDEIAGLARSMRESMDDIVWAVDPRKDRLADFVERMRQVAINSLESNGLAVEFRAPEPRELERVGLEPDRRRHLLMIVKEAVTNVARHARASRVEIIIDIGRRELRLSVRDDGRGFDAQAPSEGQGLRSLARRAADLGATLDINSSPGGGTFVDVRVPLNR